MKFSDVTRLPALFALGAMASCQTTGPTVTPPPVAQCTPEIIATRTIASFDPNGEAMDRTVRIWRAGETVGFTSHMMVNADGAPDAYKPDGKGLSFTCDGAVAFEQGANGGRCVFPGEADWQDKCNAAYRASLDNNWNAPRMCVFGFDMEGGTIDDAGRVIGGQPLIQGLDDPMPGNYISATSMRIEQATAGTQRRYVNSNEIPFIVLPPWLILATGTSIDVKGPVAYVVRPETGDEAFAIVADRGPSAKLGEGSIALHRALGSEPVIKWRLSGIDRAKRSINDDVVYLMFPSTTVSGSIDHDTFRERIDAAAGDAFSNWGGKARLAKCLEAL